MAQRFGGKAEFFLIAEAGSLEAQALLLCRSIRRFGGEYHSDAITVVSPRASRRPSRATLQELDALGAEYLALDIHSPCPEFGPSFKVLAAAHVAQRPGPPILVQVDSDTLFLGEPDFSLTGVDAAARPVDVKGMCTTGEGDFFDQYWRDLCRVCEVDYRQIPFVTTTVDRMRVRASYNGGLVAARRSSGVFELAAKFFLRFVSAKLTPWPAGTMRTGAGTVDGEGRRFWGTGQAALSIALTARGSSVRILPPSYNVPLHMFESIAHADPAPIHVHYHWLCSPGELSNNPMLDGRLAVAKETAHWLTAQLPLTIAAACG